MSSREASYRRRQDPVQAGPSQPPATTSRSANSRPATNHYKSPWTPQGATGSQAQQETQSRQAQQSAHASTSSRAQPSTYANTAYAEPSRGQRSQDLPEKPRTTATCRPQQQEQPGYSASNAHQSARTTQQVQQSASRTQSYSPNNAQAQYPTFRPQTHQPQYADPQSSTRPQPAQTAETTSYSPSPHFTAHLNQHFQGRSQTTESTRQTPRSHAGRSQREADGPRDPRDPRHSQGHGTSYHSQRGR